MMVMMVMMCISPMMHLNLTFSWLFPIILSPQVFMYMSFAYLVGSMHRMFLELVIRSRNTKDPS